MKKSAKGEVVLSPGQIHATRLNRLEYHRLQRSVTSLHEDLQNHIARIHRQELGLKNHFTNVVRVIKPNRPYQLWKQAHAREIAQDQAEELIESLKRKQKSQPKNRQQFFPLGNEIPEEPSRPLLVLLGAKQKKSVEPFFNLNENFLRPKSSPFNQQQSPSTQPRINPILNMLNGRPLTSNGIARQQSNDASSIYSLSSMETTGSKRILQTQLLKTHKQEDLDALYRIALQNQTAYKSVDQTRIEQRKLVDKEFASRHRALKGSMRSAGSVN